MMHRSCFSAAGEALDVDGDRVGDIEAVVVGIDTVVMEDKDASAAERAVTRWKYNHGRAH